MEPQDEKARAQHILLIMLAMSCSSLYGADVGVHTSSLNKQSLQRIFENAIHSSRDICGVIFNWDYALLIQTSEIEIIKHCVSTQTGYGYETRIILNQFWNHNTCCNGSVSLILVLITYCPNEITKILLYACAHVRKVITLQFTT